MLKKELEKRYAEIKMNIQDDFRNKKELEAKIQILEEQYIDGVVDAG